jgi:transposase
MDFLLEAKEDVEREVFFQTANLLNLEVDLLYFDTTSIEVEEVAEEDIRQKGHSKDSRPDLPQSGWQLREKGYR